MKKVTLQVVLMLYSISLLTAGTKWEMMEQVRADIRDFKKKEKLEKVHNYVL